MVFSAMLAILASAVASACLCVAPNDPAWLAERSDRVYRGRVVELWDLTGRPCERDRPLEEATLACVPLDDAFDGCWHPLTAVLEVLEVWKGPSERQVTLQLTPNRSMWVGWTDMVFQVGDIEVDPCCGWDQEKDLGPPRLRFEAEPTTEDLLWEAVAANDRAAVRDVLTAGPRLDLPSQVEQELPACPPPAYDELLAIGARSVARLASCTPERILPWLDVVPLDDPSWWTVAQSADVPLLDALETAGVPMAPFAELGLLGAWGRAPAMRWWIARGADPWLFGGIQWIGQPLPDAIYAVLAEVGVYPDCNRPSGA